jgi:hypothetical protein
MSFRIPLYFRRIHSISQYTNIKIREIKSMKPSLPYNGVMESFMKLVTNSSSHFFRLVCTHSCQNNSFCITLNTQTHVPSQLKFQLSSRVCGSETTVQQVHSCIRCLPTGVRRPTGWWRNKYMLEVCAQKYNSVSNMVHKGRRKGSI